MKKLLAIVASALTLGAFASAADPVITADTSAVESGTTCTVMAGDEEALEFTSNGGDVTIQIDEKYVGRRICLAVGGEEITKSTTANMGAANAKLAAIKTAGVTVNVGDAYELSNFAAYEDRAGWAPTSMKLPATESMPAGTKVAITKVVFGIDKESNGSEGAHPTTITIGGVTSSDCEWDGETAIATNGSKSSYGATYNFTGLVVVVGQTYSVTTSGDGFRGSLAKIENNASITAFTTSSSTVWSPLAKVVGEVSELAAREAITYTCTVDGETTSWSTEPGEYMIGDTLVYTGTGTASIPAGYESAPITIGEGVTLAISAGSYNATSIQNNGTINVIGGTDDAPVTITLDGAKDSSVGTVTIAENSVVKMVSTGPANNGNRKFNVTGSDASSKLILHGNVNWGMSANTQIRSCTLVVEGAEFWCEAENYLDATVNVVLYSKLHYKTTGSIGSLSGSADMVRDYTASSMTITMNGNSSYTGNFDFPLTLTGSGKLTISATTGTIDVGSNVSVGLPSGWTGTVKLASITGKGQFNFNAYGTSASTIELGEFNTTWLGNLSYTVNPKLKINGVVVLNDFSPQAYTFAEVSGTGTFALLDEGANQKVTSYTITKLVDFTGTLKSKIRLDGANNKLTIGTLVTSLNEAPSAETKVVTLADSDDKIVVNAVQLTNGTDITDSVTVSVKEDGIYVGPKAPAYPTYVDEAHQTAYTTWAEGKDLTDVDLDVQAEAFALNCEATAEAIASAKAEFKLNITVNADGSVTVTAPTGYNITPVIKGATTLDGDYTEGTEGKSFFKAEIVIPTAQN